MCQGVRTKSTTTYAQGIVEVVSSEDGCEHRRYFELMGLSLCPIFTYFIM